MKNIKELFEEKKKLANKPTMILIDRIKLRKIKRGEKWENKKAILKEMSTKDF